MCSCVMQIKFILFCIVLLFLINGSYELDRSKRFLLFPRTGRTRIQLITGIGIPVELEFESVTLGYVFKAEYFLPENASNYLNELGDPFGVTPIPIFPAKRKRKDISQTYETTKMPYEHYDVEAIEEKSGLLDDEQTINEHSYRKWYEDDEEEMPDYTLEDLKIKEPNNVQQSRFTLYKGIEKMADLSGVPGRPCMLRSICETAEVPFSFSNGILGELAHIIMTPSTTADDLSHYSDNEYLHAEELGKIGAPCGQVFKECTSSLLNRFSGIYETIKMFE